MYKNLCQANGKNKVLVSRFLQYVFLPIKTLQGNKKKRFVETYTVFIMLIFVIDGFNSRTKKGLKKKRFVL